MKPILSVLSLCLAGALAGSASELSERVWSLEKRGDLTAARDLLERAARAPGATASDLNDWAEYLDEHGDPQARAALEQALAAAQGEPKIAIVRHLVTADLLAGDSDAARKHLAAYRDAGGRDLNLPTEPVAPSSRTTLVRIPGPLPSFARMAALSPDLDPAAVLAALARNVVTNGYQASSNSDALDQTEYLKLVIRYVSQARELSKLAGKDSTIRIATCDSTETGDLLRVLGYRMRGGCGSDVVLETVNPSRAFLTIDSGFPLASLEQAMRTNRPFAYDYRSAEIPVVYGPDYWLSSHGIQGGDLVEAFLNDPSLCRLYLAMTKLDPSTADEIRKSVPATRLRIFAHVLDFFGGMFEIRGGRAVVPGGPRTEKTWGELAGTSPEKGAEFFEKLITKDDGWLASYYDSLARIGGPVQDYLTEPERLKRFYLAIRGKVTSPGPARPVFRSNTDMVLLTTRLRMDAHGKPVMPGGLEVWRNLFVHHPAGKYDSKLSKAASGWKEPDDVLEALFGLCRKAVDNEALRIFMALSDLDRGRATPLDANTAERLIRNWHEYGAQYPIFAEVPDVSPATLVRFLDAAASVNGMKEGTLRADIAGTLQALTGLWQILYRHGSLPAADADKTLSAILNGFAKIANDRDLFTAGRAGVNALLAATGSRAGATPQERLVELLAGPDSASDADTRNRMVRDMAQIFEAQRLISVTDLFAIADGLDAVARGEKGNPAVVAKAAARIAEVQLPHAALSSVEKNAFTFGYWSERHIEAERKVNLKVELDRAGADARKLSDIRGDLAPLLRDSLVGLNYVYYAPPGAQILQANPVFVRSHDFIGLNTQGQTWRTTDVQGGGWPSNTGGKLSGSLAQLPYALAQAEQNFLVPTREQALIWSDLVPQLLASATVPRWWRATPAHTHWVMLHMDYGETLLAEAALSDARRQRVLAVLHRYAAPVRVAEIDQLLRAGDVRAAVAKTTPAELFELARISAGENGDEPLAAEIRRIAREAPNEINYAVISRLFGTPKPTLANSMSPQLLNLRTFPALMGYSSRILAESWESDLLYYAAISDQLNMPPSQLNLMIPYWTRQTIEGIFATHLEDWPALLRSLRTVGDEALAKSRRQGAASGAE
ncbi:MAG: hypothetical protein ABSH47_15560 [Bryobacteraceae bacterium]|jgi:hypothetical protein